MTDIYISEIFGPTIQGEGHLIGKPTVFVRVGGCDFRCQWCDSLYAVDAVHRPSWERLDSETIFARINALTNNQPILVTLSGGNPAIFDFSTLIDLGQKAGFHFAMETQGSIVKDYFRLLDYLIVSPKPPSAKVNIDAEKASQLLEKTLASHPSPQLKIVVADAADYAFAKSIHQQYPHIPMTLQPCNPFAHEPTVNLEQLNERLKWLLAKTIADEWYNVKLLPQLHVMLWQNERGV